MFYCHCKPGNWYILFGRFYSSGHLDKNTPEERVNELFLMTVFQYKFSIKLRMTNDKVFMNLQDRKTPGKKSWSIGVMLVFTNSCKHAFLFTYFMGWSIGWRGHDWIFVLIIDWLLESMCYFDSLIDNDELQNKLLSKYYSLGYTIPC